MKKIVNTFFKHVLSVVMIYFVFNPMISFAKEINNKLQLSIRLKDNLSKVSDFPLSEGVKIECVLKNVSDESISFFWAGDDCFYAGTVIVLSEKNKIRLDSNYSPPRLWRIPVLKLDPGEVHAFEVDINKIYGPRWTLMSPERTDVSFFEPGSYTVQLSLVLESENKDPPIPSRVESNILKIDVPKLTGKQQREVLDILHQLGIEKRLLAIAILVENLDGKERSDLILRCVSSPHKDVRILGIVLAGKYKEGKRFDLVKRIMLKDSSVDIRAHATLTIGEINPTAATPILLQCIKENKGCPRAAIHALKRIGNKAILPALEEILNENSLDKVTKSMLENTIESIKGEAGK